MLTDDWFRWMIGGLVAFYTAVTSWVVVTMFTTKDKIWQKVGQLENRMVALEVRPQIDVVKYTELTTRLAEAIANLTAQLSRAEAQRHKDHQELVTKYEELRREIQELREELLVPGR